MKQKNHWPFLFSISFFSFLQIYSQSIPTILPPSPQTKELNKYVDFPVDLNSGIPEISIPLYVIKTKGLDIPITLSYHASGIKHGQDDGDVGLGWSLSCNYRVSRTIYGQPDSRDIQMSPAMYQSKMQQYANDLSFPAVSGSVSTDDRHLLYPFLNRDKFLKRFLNQSYATNPSFPSQSETLLDGEYDHFNYSIPGGGGKFIIIDRDNNIVKEINPSRNKIGYIEGTALNNYASGIIGFNIKDESQNTFSFGEQVDKLGATVLEKSDLGGFAGNATAWALTDIDTKFGEKIKLQC